MTAPHRYDDTPPFRKGGDNVLMELLNQSQRIHDRQRDNSAQEPCEAMPTETVRHCLSAVGMSEGLDSIATEHFFGPTGQDGYTDGDENFAINTHGGFIFEAPADEGRYVITATSISGSSLPKRHTRPVVPRRRDVSAGSLETIKCWVRDTVLRGADNDQPPPTGSAGAVQWSVSAAAGCYQVQPRFHEDIDIMDLLPFAEHVDDPAQAGLISLYPLEDEAEVCIHTGVVNTDSADEALQLADRLRAIMAEHGVLCDPRVVLLESGDLPLLPHHARKECLWQAEERHEADDAKDEEILTGSSFLGAAHLPGNIHDDGHRVRKSRGNLVPDQQQAAWLAREASRLSAYHDKAVSWQRCLEDPSMPERRKEHLRERLDEALAVCEEARSNLNQSADDLTGLLLSLLDERPELAKEALLRRQGV